MPVVGVGCCFLGGTVFLVGTEFIFLIIPSAMLLLARVALAVAIFHVRMEILSVEVGSKVWLVDLPFLVLGHTEWLLLD